MTDLTRELAIWLRNCHFTSAIRLYWYKVSTISNKDYKKKKSSETLIAESYLYINGIRTNDAKLSDALIPESLTTIQMIPHLFEATPACTRD